MHENRDPMDELRAIVLTIGLMSQVGAAPLTSTPRATDDEIGGRRPSGGADRKGDKIPEYRQKSAEYFQRKLSRCHTESQLWDLLAEARQALTDWRRTPTVAGVEPERDSFLWCCQVADDPRPIKEVQRAYSVSRSTVNRYRAKYRGVRALLRREST